MLRKRSENVGLCRLPEAKDHRKEEQLFRIVLHLDQHLDFSGLWMVRPRSLLVRKLTKARYFPALHFYSGIMDATSNLFMASKTCLIFQCNILNRLVMGQTHIAMAYPPLFVLCMEHYVWINF